MTDFQRIRLEVFCKVMDKYPGYSKKGIARILHADYPEFFESVERARDFVRLYTGAKGKKDGHKVKLKKYFDVQPT